MVRGGIASVSPGWSVLVTFNPFALSSAPTVTPNSAAMPKM
jgi:hypothetical protein